MNTSLCLSGYVDILGSPTKLYLVIVVVGNNKVSSG